ncbi:MAG TPA: MBOAT family O-acyltransferase [Kofleriaceae bacterium]|nr:MBOAT family O-acyltransferase [Kofleriaceae bacterium]
MYFLDERFLLFAPALVCVYWLAGERLRNWVLLAGSLVWLAMFSVPTVVALSTLALGVIYPAAWLASRRRARGDERGASVVAWTGIAVVIAVAALLRLKGHWFHLVAGPGYLELLRWIGFSYFVLKAIHVMRATARGIIELSTPLTVLTYVVFLPTLTSGPIYRLDTFAQQLAEPKRLGWDDLNDGLFRVLLGIGKKVVFALPLSKLTTALHAKGLTHPAAYVVTYVILYLDFSGYTDIAIGFGRLLGFRVPENFKHPFTATTLTQFWRNWHATLTDWQRENVFVPLGGMRARGWRLWGIVLGAMLIVGIWHAFTPIFLLWGLYHGTLLLLENWLDIKPLHAHRTPRWRLWLRYGLVQIAVMGGMFAFIGTDLGIR